MTTMRCQLTDKRKKEMAKDGSSVVSVPFFRYGRDWTDLHDRRLIDWLAGNIAKGTPVVCGFETKPRPLFV